MNVKLFGEGEDVPMVMKHVARSLGIGSSLLLLLCIVATGPFVAYAAPSCAGKSSICTWHIVNSPNVGQNSNELYSIATISAHDAWAVGAENASNGLEQPLAEHWNGKTWSVFASPNPKPTSNGFFQGVSALSKNDVWAVGSYTDPTATGNQTLVEHWNGKMWNVVASPNPTDPYPNGNLDSIVAISANNVWAAGFYTDTTINAVKTLVEHWNGQQWSIVSTPNPASYNILYSITAVSANNIWAVGSYTLPINGGSYALVEHWNGQQWSIVSTPQSASNNNVLLLSVSALTAKDVWAVGSYNTSGTTSNTLVEHWNGSQWSIVSSPIFQTSTTLSGVAALSKDNAWAVGNSFDSSNPNGVSTTLIEHWNGKTWSVVSSPNPNGPYATLNTAAHVPGTSTLLAGGYYALPGSTKNNVVEQTLIEQYS